jgi:hypothetical protein
LAWKLFDMERHGNGMERFVNRVEMPMEWNGMSWKGMTMAWHGNDMEPTRLWDWVWEGPLSPYVL